MGPQIFRDEVFPHIDEKPFSVLCSDACSRPDTPVNVIIAALILKEIFHLSDDQIVAALMFDVRFQHAQRGGGPVPDGSMACLRTD